MILAAGHGRRFGGPKQLVPVSVGGRAIMDLTAAAAYERGYDGVVLVVREEIEREVAAHVRRLWPGGLDVEIVRQGDRPGTAAAIDATRAVVEAPFAVANADDLYSVAALACLRKRLVAPDAGLTSSAGSDLTGSAAHLLVTYRLKNTLLGEQPVNRGLCVVGNGARLMEIVEYHVEFRRDGGYDAVPLAAQQRGSGRQRRRRHLLGDESVSMNLWGFQSSFLDDVRDALEQFDPATAPRPELLLSDVVGALLEAGEARFEVVESDSRCIGITHPGDVALVREELDQHAELWGPGSAPDVDLIDGAAGSLPPRSPGGNRADP